MKQIHEHRLVGKRWLLMLALVVALVGCNAETVTTGSGTGSTQSATSDATAPQPSSEGHAPTSTSDAEGVEASGEAETSAEASVAPVASSAPQESSATEENAGDQKDDLYSEVKTLVEELRDFPFDSAGSSLKMAKLSTEWLNKGEEIASDVVVLETALEKAITPETKENFQIALESLTETTKAILSKDASKLADVTNAGATLSDTLPTEAQWTQVLEALQNAAK